MAQVGLNNAFDFRSIDNLYFDESTKVEEETLGSPFFTPLIDGYRYNSFLDIIVNSQNEIVTISELQLGKYNFVKKDYFVRWKKKATTGYLIKIDETSFLRVQKVIREDYNPKLKNNSNKRYEEKISYFKKEDGKIKQVKKNENAKGNFFVHLNYIQSKLNNYLGGSLSNRNSVYYAFGRSFRLTPSNALKSKFFFSKNGGFDWYTEDNYNGKKIITLNTVGLELLYEKSYKRFSFFSGIKSHYALKREERRASIRYYGFRLRDKYQSLNDELKKFIPISLPLGFSFDLIEDIDFELIYNFGVSKLNAAPAEINLTLNTLQAGLVYKI